MGYDETLAERVRQLLDHRPDVTEKRMFGGLAFLIGGNMAVAASGQGGLLVRCDPARGDELLDETGAEPMVMRGRPIEGWLRVSAEAAQSEADLERWVQIGTSYAAGLPPK